MLYVTGDHDGSISLSNTSSSTPNNWTGGTWVTGTNLYVSNGAVLGSGPIVIGGCGSNGGGKIWLDGPGNIANNNQVILENTDESSTVGLYVCCATQTIGSLEGNGIVQLGCTGNNYNGTPTLTVGTNNLSTNFYGTIQDDSQGAETGSLVKTGTGTLTLWGDVLLAGGVTVNGGSLIFNGSLGTASLTGVQGAITVNSGTLTLSPTGNYTPINRAVTVGQAAGTAGTFNITNSTLNGTFTLNNGTVTANGATINVTSGNLAIGQTTSGGAGGTFNLTNSLAHLQHCGVPLSIHRNAVSE